MFKEHGKTIKVAAIQMASKDGKVKENLDRAEVFLTRAAEQNAQFVIFPEFMPEGYRLTREIWETAETINGYTARWMKKMSKRFGIYIGTTFLEYETNDFYNSFILTTPMGEIAGRVRKRFPSIWEAYFFKGDRGKQFIDTEIGRIGIGICFDNHTYEVCKSISESNVDIMFMPHSYCVPTKENKVVSKQDIERLYGLPTKVAKIYNEILGIPVIMVNKCGQWDSPLPTNIIPKMESYAFTGKTCVIAANGDVKVELGDSEGIAISEVTLNSKLKKNNKIPKHSRYIYPGQIGREISRLLELMGKLSYKLNDDRRKMVVE